MQPDDEYTQLDRKFRALKSEELEQPDLLAAVGDGTLLTGISWDELLELPRVLILAEASSGKTTEMREAANRLNKAGKSAFVLPLEDLDKDGVQDILNGESARRYQAWRQDGQSIGWFFLDSVDELKLHRGSLRRALRRFANDLDGLLGRTRVVVSSRPHDWQPLDDMTLFREHLPVSVPPREPAEATNLFVEKLRAGRSAQNARDRKKDVTSAEPKVVVLLPLGDKQIETYVQARSPGQDAAAFLAELKLQHAQTFARRPGDLRELLISWNVNRVLGTREQQHESNVASKLHDAPGRLDAGDLKDTQAREGAERLALALALMRRRTIRSADAGSAAMGASDAMIDPALILPDYSPAERATLLRRGLFDPATYGRIRFHDRSVQEYLAAKRLLWLRKNGMTRSSLHRLLFADADGERLSLPSMRPIAAWLALWDVDVKRELMARQPEALASMGDPAALQLEDKILLVKAFATAYGTGGGRGINVPIDSVRRLADHGLDPTIRELWKTYKHNDDVSELLLELLWQSKSVGCRDICVGAALDTVQEPYERVIAIRALVDSGSHTEARQVVSVMMADVSQWPARVIHGVAADLYPGILTLDELLELVRATPEPKSVISGFAWQMQIICKSLDPKSADAPRLTSWLSDIIWDERRRDVDIFQAESRRSYLATGLAILCTRRLQAGADPTDATLARAIVVANRFAPDRDVRANDFVALRKEVDKSVAGREATFWSDIEVVRELEPGKDAWHQYYNALHDGVVQTLVVADATWLLPAFRQRTNIGRAEIALHGLLNVYQRAGGMTTEMTSVGAEASTDPALAEIFRIATTPTPLTARMREAEEKEARRRAAHEQLNKDNEKDWTDWRERVMTDPAMSFANDKVKDTLTSLHEWLSEGDYDLTFGAQWRRRAIAEAFSDEFARLAEDAFKRYWRTIKVERDTGSSGPGRLRIDPNERFLAQWGIAAEAENKSWASNLSRDDARLAAELATQQMDGLPEWLVDIAAAYPAIVEEVIGDELDAEVRDIPTLVHLPTLQDIRHSAVPIKRLLHSRIERVFANWPASAPTSELASPFSHVSEELAEILFETAPHAERVDYAKTCLDRSTQASNDEASLQWLRLALMFDFEQGATALDARLSPLQRKDAERVLAAMFNRRHGIAVPEIDPEARARILGRLVRTAYRAVAIVDDQSHDGSYTPDIRDHAQTARGILFSALLDTKGPQARAELLAMAQEPLFAHMPDRLRMMARERIAHDAEFVSLDEKAYRVFNESRERPAVDRDSLAEIAESRLADLQHDIAHHDFSDRRTLRTIQDEVEMQRTLALRLDVKANGTYVVTREDEVADLKRTDIRLAGLARSARYTIEIKIADKRWTLAQLEYALEHQLLAQYLRHANSQAGCLLLTYRGDKKTWSKGKGRGRKSLTFKQLVEHLGAQARAIEVREEGRVRITVVGLDLQDP